MCVYYISVCVCVFPNIDMENPCQAKLSTSELPFLPISTQIYWRVDFPSGLEWKLLEEGGCHLL